MSCPPVDQIAGEALGSRLLYLLDALVKEYTRLKDEHESLVATIADSSQIMRKQTSPAPELSEVSGDELPVIFERTEPIVKTQASPDVGLPAEQQLPVHHEGFNQMMARGLSKGALLKKTLHFEMLSHWKGHPELMHMTLSQVHSSTALRISSGKTKELEHGSNPLAIHPESYTRHFWIWSCICLLVLDLFWVPVDVGFDLEGTLVSKIVHYVGMIYWTLDIPMSFLTGVAVGAQVEMRLQYIARGYARSWLCFDILLLLPDYIHLVAKDSPAVHISILRVFRWGRFMRLLRVARLSRVTKFKAAIRSVAVRYHLSTLYVEMSRGFVGLTCAIVVWIHIQTCLWHGFGTLFEDGWIQANSLESASVGKLYAVSFHWSCSRLIGSDSRYDLKTVPELTLGSLLLFVNLLATASMLASVTVLAITRTTSKPFNMWKSSVKFSIRHDLSLDLEMRMGKLLQVIDFGNAGELAEQEQALLCTFPDSLREDILFETRVPCLAYKQFIHDIVRINERAARHLCYAAITEAVVAPDEVIFEQGDAGRAMRFVSHGSFAYSFPTCEHIEESCALGRGSSLSEAVLWTKWEHVGTLRAVEDPGTFVLDHELFARTVTNHKGSLVYAVRYAKHFVRKLNQSFQSVHDLTEFRDLDLEFLNENAFKTDHEEHFIFISHYKVEAGTEATLMCDTLKDLLMNDPEHAATNMLQPVFIDSENLTDLVRLKAHVKKSDVLLLLLTPGVLSRPWCLIEIATAIKHSVSIVLVEIQRPGSKFQYPDDEFYEKLLAGSTLEPQSVSLLESHGVTLQKLERELRRIFCKISLPFSPHRSEEVREAELRDILKRSYFEYSKKSEVYHPQLIVNL